MPWTVPSRKQAGFLAPANADNHILVQRRACLAPAQQVGRLGEWSHSLLHAYWAPPAVGTSCTLGRDVITSACVFELLLGAL